EPLLSLPNGTHCNANVEGPVPDHQSPFEPATPPPCSFNRHGQTETLRGVEMTHHFVEAGEATWHLVTAGDPENPPIVFIHGLPESWYGFHHQVAALSDEYYTVAIDQLGYGQSDKRLELGFDNPAIAQRTAALLDVLGIEDFYLVTHDRGSATGDYLTAGPGMEARMIRWVRMQQSANEPHGYPRPPHLLFGSEYGAQLFSSAGFVAATYDSDYVARPLPPQIIERLDFEFMVEGIAQAVRANFQTTNFDIELEDRIGEGGLIDTMTMPILFLQGPLDPGQKPEEYEQTAEFFPNEANEVVMLEGASHFTASEQPQIVSTYIRTFFEGERL
ncbi:MAG: alpha/beta hydrolase, partial [Myxococcota bacterium]